MDRNDTIPSTLTAPWPALLMSGPNDTRLQQVASLSPSDWDHLIRQAQVHGLAPLLYVTLQSLPQEDVLIPATAAAMQTLKAIYRQATLLAMQRTGELGRLLDALNQAGICPVVFKGAALAHTLYPSPACRLMGDIDLWVTHDEMPGAIAVLGEVGYRFREKEHRPHALTRHTDGEVQMLPGKTGQGLVELHWGVFPGEWLAHTASVDRAGVRSRLVQATLLERPVQLMMPEDALIQLIVHISINHQMSTNALRSLVDVALFSRQKLDWEVVVERANAWRVAAAVGLTLDLVRQIFGLPDLPGPIQEIVPVGLQRRLLDRFVSPQGIIQGQLLSADRRRLLYLLCITDSPAASLRLLTHSLWPDPAWLSARYGQSDWLTQLRHAANSMVGRV
jgi:hypothetical protein